MTYAFRKYLNKRGSALFMVLSLMTALMILVMAMYFSVVSSRDVQYKVFYQEQAYRSATSLSDAIVAGLKGNSWQTATGSSPLLSAFTNMSEGDTITTNGNDFKAFVLTGSKEEQDQLGAYTVSITRMADETINDEKTRVYDVAITTSSGGVLDTTHTFIHIQEPESEASQGKTNIFTSTGYVPNDVFLDTVETWTDLFYDNEYVVVTGQSHIYSNLYAGGSLTINEASATPSHKGLAATWAIRNNFTNRTTLGLGSNTENGLLLVGGDATFAGGNINNADIYVLGDVYLTSGTNFNNCRMFVYGNIIFENSSNLPSVRYASGIVNNTGYDIGTINLTGKWRDNTSLPTDVMSSHDTALKLDSLTASNNYSKWEINDDAPAKNYYVKELDPSSTSYTPLTIEFGKDQYTYYLDWKDGYQISDYFGAGQPLNYTPYVIEDIKADWTGANDARECGTIVIDTGDDANNQVLIKVNANRDTNGDNHDDTFEWAPEGHNYDTMTVLVRGKGSVVIDLPEGVTYQASNDTSVMHETWYAIFGGAIEQMGAANNRNTLTYTQGSAAAITVTPETGMQYIHTDCDENCTECNYQVKTTGTDKCSECNNNVTTISCADHNMTYSFCPDCNPSYAPEKNNSGDYYGLCANRIERSAVETKVNSLATSNPLMYSTLVAGGDGTNWYYPNNNIFIVSCDESADIRLATDRDGAAFSKAGLWGFVYAPYMTYKGMGNGAGWAIFGGGMIVADYVIKNFDIYLACYPDQLPEDLMNEANRKDQLQALASKSWKISLAGY